VGPIDRFCNGARVAVGFTSHSPSCAFQRIVREEFFLGLASTASEVFQSSAILATVVHWMRATLSCNFEVDL
jgi:hypothetical protein